MQCQTLCSKGTWPMHACFKSRTDTSEICSHTIQEQFYHMIFMMALMLSLASHPDLHIQHNADRKKAKDKNKITKTDRDHAERKNNLE